jgi:hypothetical protein
MRAVGVRWALATESAPSWRGAFSGHFRTAVAQAVQARFLLDTLNCASRRIGGSRRSTMATVRFRLTGETKAVQSTLAAIRDVEDVDRIEEVADQSAHLRDDSSSAGTYEDTIGDFHDIEVHAMTDRASDDVRDCVERAARAQGIALEFVDRF